MSTLSVIAIVLGLLAIERIVVISTTRSAACQPFYRRCPLLHPNGISIMRLPMGILSCLLVTHGHWTLGTLWFSFWMITDMSDGTIARNCQLETETGKWLDPLSDKFMYFPPLFYMSCGSVLPFGLELLPFSLVLPFMVFDVLGQLSRLWVQKKAANMFGKAKTALVTVLLALLSLDQISPLRFGSFELMNESLRVFLMFFCLMLAFLSFYCKVIPDAWYSTSLILLNIICAATAIALCIVSYNTDGLRFTTIAFVLVYLGQFFDLFDGRLAKYFGSTQHRALLDELADGLGFGLALATLIFLFIDRRETLLSPMIAALIAMIYMTAVTVNLVRFHHIPLPLPSGRFCGLPISVGAGLAGSTVLLCVDFPQAFAVYIACAVILLTALLMILPLPYQHLGETIWAVMPRALKLAICLVVLVFVCITSSHRSIRFVLMLVTFICCLLYVFLGLHWKNASRNEA